MKILAIIFIIQKLVHELNCHQLTHVNHMCSDGNSAEQAGMGSGTLTFDGSLCQLTITDIPELRKKNSRIVDQVSRLNIVGVRRNESCNTSEILIDSEIYCTDESVEDTVINVTDQQMKFAVVFNLTESITLRYYRGELLRNYQLFSLFLDQLEILVIIDNSPECLNMRKWMGQIWLVRIRVLLSDKYQLKLESFLIHRNIHSIVLA